MNGMKITAGAVGVAILAGTGWFYKRADGREAPAYRTATIERGRPCDTGSSRRVERVPNTSAWAAPAGPPDCNRRARLRLLR